MFPLGGGVGFCHVLACSSSCVVIGDLFSGCFESVLGFLFLFWLSYSWWPPQPVEC